MSPFLSARFVRDVQIHMDLPTPPTAQIDAVRRWQSWANFSPEKIFSTALRKSPNSKSPIVRAQLLIRYCPTCHIKRQMRCSLVFNNVVICIRDLVINELVGRASAQFTSRSMRPPAFDNGANDFDDRWHFLSSSHAKACIGVPSLHYPN